MTFGRPPRRYTVGCDRSVPIVTDHGRRRQLLPQTAQADADSFSLEQQLEPHLPYSRRRGGAEDFSEISVRQGGVWISKHGVVQCVEELGAELQLEPLPDREILKHGE